MRSPLTPYALALTRAAALLGSVLAAGLVGCDAAPVEPGAEPPPPAARSYDPSWEATRERAPRGEPGQRRAVEKRKVHALPVAHVAPRPDDPQAGSWSLDDATAGLGPTSASAGTGLSAVLDTTLGELRCTLWPDKAPITVANFVGLARGLRPWRSPKEGWGKRPAYDGSRFDRVLPGLVIQAGSPDGTREGGPGYAIPDEIWEDANHDRAGLLCMAPARRNEGGMQFLITDGSALHLDGSYTIFGECGPIERVHQIASVEADRGTPREPVLIRTVRIERPAPDASATPSPATAGAPAARPTPAPQASP